MKITVLSPWYFPHSGGYSTFCKGIMDALNEKWDARLIVTYNRAIIDQLQPEGKLGFRESTAIHLAGILRFFRIISDETLWAISSAIKGKKLDIIHTNGMLREAFIGFFLHVTTGAKAVHTFHTQPERRTGLLSRIMYKIVSSSVKTTAVSHSLSEEVWKLYGVKPDAVLYPGISDDFFRIKSTNGKKRVYLTIANMFWKEKTYGLLELIDIFRSVEGKLKQAELWIVGEGQYSGLIMEKAGGTVKFLGKKEPKEIMEILGKAYMYVHYSYQESLGISIIEAMAAGKPVIAYDAGGVSELVTKETGSLVSNREEFCNALIKPCSPDAYRLLSGNARRAASAFSEENFRKNLISLYISL